MNRLYFIEESVFSTEKFYTFLEILLSDKNIEPYFAVDSNIQEELKKYFSMGLYEEAYNIQTYLYFFANRKKLKYIDTKGYLDVEDLLNKSKKYDEVYILTQKSDIYDVFKGIKENNNKFKIYSIKHQNLIEWKDIKRQTFESFYVENDKYIIHDLNIEKIDTVFSQKYGYLKLDKDSGISGGEGICYKSYNNLFVKLYNKNHLTYVNMKKLQRMMEIDISNEFILWPIDLVYYKNNFVGYVMKELKGCINIDDMRDLGFRVGDMVPLDRYRICLNFLKQVDYLHRKQILVGDMKPDNILVKAPTSVYIIDAGSFQVENYGCDVCHPAYTQRTWSGDELKHTLRTREDEYFPINRILFEMMMLKSPFYNRENIEVNEEGNRKFEYPMKKNLIVGNNPGTHLILWFAMTQRMREFFYNYFAKNKITDLSEWIRELELFIKQKEKNI